MSRAVLSLGANLGDRAAALRAAVAALKDDGVLVARSTLYETPPWGPVEQPPYLNAVVVVRGDRDAAGWLARAQELEQAAGRTRDVLRRNGGRPGHVFNLGNGVLPELDPGILAEVVNLVHAEGRTDGTFES